MEGIYLFSPFKSFKTPFRHDMSKMGFDFMKIRIFEKERWFMFAYVNVCLC